MSYFTPYVDDSGYHYPTYEDILDDIITRFQEIFGAGIYLGSDSQDYEMIAIFALKIFDAYQAVELAYNAHSPVTAIGNALDYVVAINGIKRLQGTNSTVVVTLTGSEGTTITNGIVSDVEGRLWDLPETVVIGSNGTASATATCRETGVVAAEAGAVSRIMTPTLGWVSVTNPSAAVTGTYTESDSALRERQMTSVAQPSQTILSGLRGALLALDCVERCEVYENDTNVMISTGKLAGLTAHSICAVVDFDNMASTAAADRQTIANTILMYKSCGCATYGDITESVPDGIGGTYSIKFMRMEQVDIDVSIELSKLDGYSIAYRDKIRVAVATYLNSLDAGQSVSIALLTAIIMTVNESLTNPAFTVSTVQIKKSTDSVYGDTDIALTFAQVAHGSASETNIPIDDGIA